MGDTVADVTACFEAYDAALLANDIEQLDGWFWPGEDAVRIGIGEELYGAAAIAAYRRAAPTWASRGPLTRRVVAAFGDEIATVCVEFDFAPGLHGRQTQTWFRSSLGWRIVCAHVSTREEGH